jgi:hypothetical protein
MKTIKLTNEEFEIVKIALGYVYDEKIKFLKQHKATLGKEAFFSVLNQARKYWELQYDLDKGKHDV